MAPSQSSFPRPPRPKAASPAERSEEFAEIQRNLKAEAAERRANQPEAAAPKRRPGRSEARG